MPARTRRRSFRHRAETIICDGERQWRIGADEVVTGPAGRRRDEIANLLDRSWLLEHRLTGGAETATGGPPGYRLRVACRLAVGAGVLRRRGRGGRRARHPAALHRPFPDPGRCAVRAARRRTAGEQGDFRADIGGHARSRKNRTTSRPARAASRRRGRSLDRPAGPPGTRDQRSRACSAAGGADWPSGSAQDDAGDLAGDDDQAGHVVARVGGVAGQDVGDVVAGGGDAGTSMVKRTLPLTWTGRVTVAVAARAGSACGNGSQASEPGGPAAATVPRRCAGPAAPPSAPAARPGRAARAAAGPRARSAR